MKYVEVIASEGNTDTVVAIAEEVKAKDYRVDAVGEDGLQRVRILVTDGVLQKTLDTLQSILSTQSRARIVVLPVEIYLPRSEGEADEDEKDPATLAREALYKQVETGARLDADFGFLVILSTVVAAIGLVEGSVAVVIGAMVIAPLLGPNLALSLGTALGDLKLVKQSVKSLSLGIVVSVALSVLIGSLWPSDLQSHELFSRTTANLDSIALALTSGAAATLSLTTGLSGVLVGVMVAVALLPPAVTMGIMLGGGDIQLAIGAGLLLAINIVCVNLASVLVFLLKGVSPRTWTEKKQAKAAMTRYLLGWIVTLAVLVALIYFRGSS
ncbi:MAG: TIGR00341 family protein [Burkholderiaceae bacterium]